MQEKEKQELFKQFNRELCELCKDGEDLDRVEYLIDAGADLFYQSSKPLYWATKKKNYPLIDLLIEKGALKDPRSIGYIAQICDYKDFKGRAEESFFELLDKARAITGANFDYFVPYINSMIIHGKLDKLHMLMDRYGLTETEVVKAVYPRVIFEAIRNGHNNSLNFINANLDWMDQSCLDGAVSAGETDVVKYLYDNSTLGLPGQEAILRAIFDGSVEILDLLIERGLQIEDNPLYLAKACRSFYSNGPVALEYLLDHGYSLTDSYGGKTILEHAELDHNTPLLQFLKAYNIE